MNPECISAETQRASARACRSAGQMPSSGCVSARYSRMARLSQIAKSPSSSSGTMPEGLYLAVSAPLDSGSAQPDANLLERQPEVPHGKPGPQAPARPIFVADDQAIAICRHALALPPVILSCACAASLAQHSCRIRSRLASSERPPMSDDPMMSDKLPPTIFSSPAATAGQQIPVWTVGEGRRPLDGAAAERAEQRTGSKASASRARPRADAPARPRRPRRRRPVRSGRWLGR